MPKVDLSLFDQLESNVQYDDFVNKFKAKKTTDDCFTPQPIYDAIAKYVAERYNVKTEDFIRPFYPGGNFERHDYPKDCVVVDNPPFSILAKIVKFYQAHRIKFFLFAPTLTLFGALRNKGVTAVCTSSTVTYANGAEVNTSFLTNMSPELLVDVPSKLYFAIQEANRLCLNKKKQPIKRYDVHLCSAATLGRLKGTDFVINVNDGVFDDTMFGGSVLMSTAKAQEKESRAEQSRAID